MQDGVALMDGCVLGLLHGCNLQRRCVGRGVVHLVRIVHDLRGDGGLGEEILVIHVGGDEAALDGALQQHDDDQAVDSGQVALNIAQAVDGPEADAEDSDQQRHGLKPLAAGHAAFDHQPDDEEQRQHKEPCHHRDVHESVAITAVIGFKTVRKGEYQLVQVVGEHHAQQKQRRDEQIAHPYGAAVTFRLADVVHHKHADQGYQHHGDIIAVPAVAANGPGDDHIIIFDDAGNLPEQQQSPHAQQHFADGSVQDPSPDGDTPHDRQGNLHGPAGGHHRDGQQGILRHGMEHKPQGVREQQRTGDQQQIGDRTFLG